MDANNDHKSFRMKTIHKYSNLSGSFNASLKELESSELELERTRNKYIQARENHFVQHYIRYFGISILGSARIERNTPEWAFDYDLGKSLVSSFKVDVITGGGPGVMEAVHEGARKAVIQRKIKGELGKSSNIGLGIVLPNEQGLHPYVDIGNQHKTFTTRKQEFLERSHGMYASHGGLGTLDEIAEVLCAKQCGLLEKEFPIILHPQWYPLIGLLEDMLYNDKIKLNQTPTMNEFDLKDIIISDDIPEITKIFKKRYDSWKENIKSKAKKIM